MISRGCTKACVIKDLKIPKDSPILIPVYSIQRDPAVFPNPEKFDPERFSPLAKQSRNPYSFLPFGHGPHNCIGMRFAKMQIRLVLARMLRKYRLQVAPDTKIPPDIKAKATLGSPEINLRIVSRAKKTWQCTYHQASPKRCHGNALGVVLYYLDNRKMNFTWYEVYYNYHIQGSQRSAYVKLLGNLTFDILICPPCWISDFCQKSQSNSKFNSKYRS